ncbi:MAG: hypothetical protein Q4D04_11580 [Clostridia bacterium]|nr:hypothetical protein [Clostridia bacterium]
MRSLAIAARVTKLQLVKGMCQAKIWIALLFVPLILWPALNPIKRMAIDVGESVSIMGIVFIFSDINNSALSTMFSIGVVILFSDAPFADATQQQCLMRVSGREWISAQIMYILCLSAIYVLYWIVSAVIILMPVVSLSLEWDAVWRTLAHTNAGAQYGITLDLSVALIRAYDPWQSFAISIALKIAICLMFGNLCFATSLWTKTNAGIYVCLAIVMQDYMAMNGLGFSYIKFAPQTMSRLIMLDPIGTGMKPTPAFALTVLLSISVIFAFTSYLARKNRLPE